MGWRRRDIRNPERIGDANGPLAIPALMSFGLARNDEIRSKARSIIRQLFDELPVQALRARRRAMHFVGTPGRLVRREAGSRG